VCVGRGVGWVDSSGASELLGSSLGFGTAAQ
jgi:hypothetical protein